MKRKRTLADLVPPGAKFKRDLGLLALWFALFVLLGSFLIFVIRYENARSRLYEDVLGRRLLRSGAQIDPLAEILSGTFGLAVVYGILTFVNIAANYMTFYRESKSIYLMRRIPRPVGAAAPLCGCSADRSCGGDDPHGRAHLPLQPHLFSRRRRRSASRQANIFCSGGLSDDRTKPYLQILRQDTRAGRCLAVHRPGRACRPVRRERRGQKRRC